MKVTRVSLGDEAGSIVAWEEEEDATEGETKQITPLKDEERMVEGRDEAGPTESEEGYFRRRQGVFRRLASTRGLTSSLRKKKEKAPPVKACEKDGELKSGWVRVFPEAARGCDETGSEPWNEQETTDGEAEHLGTLVHLTPTSTAADICRDLHLTHNQTVWVQYGGGISRRLTSAENPLMIQDGFLRQLGYCELSRRSRLGIDPELRHLIRFHIGPSVPIPALEGITRCGTVHVLKGHAFPQWKPRPVAILGNTLFIFPSQDAGSGIEGETLDLIGGHVVGGVSKGGRLMLRVAPATSSPQRPVFLGFDEARERRIWWKWISKFMMSTELWTRIRAHGRLRRQIEYQIYAVHRMLTRVCDSCLPLESGATETPPQQESETEECGQENSRSLPSSEEDNISGVLDLSRGHLDGRLPSAKLLLRAAVPPSFTTNVSNTSQVEQSKRTSEEIGDSESSSSILGGPKAIDLSGNRLGYEERKEDAKQEEKLARTESRGRADGGGAANSFIVPASEEVSKTSNGAIELNQVSEDPGEEEEDLRVLLSGVRSLRLSGNGLTSVPKTLLKLLRGAGGPPPSPPPTPRRHHLRGRKPGMAIKTRGAGTSVPLVRLDLSENQLEELPEDIGKLHSLEWLSLENNNLTAMPSALPRRLRCLLLGKNRIRSVGTEGPSGKLRESKGGNNKAKKPREINGEGVEDGEEEVDGEEAKKMPRRRCWEETKNPGDQEVTQLSPSLLEKIDLRANLLDGDVVLGNYENLKELDLSDNEIERLDVRSLRHLSVVQCARNSLVHLSLPGHKLTTLVASQNRLVSLNIEPTPLNLEHLNVSRNELEVLPDWPWERFRQLNFLDASHNHLQNLPHRLHVAPNLTELHLHANRINTLHEGFLSSPSLQVINLSNNLLSGGLPTLVLGSNGLLPWSSPLLSLRLTGNNLTDAIWEALSELTALQVLHLAYNSLTTMPEKCVEMWTDMEELIVSGNMLCILPDSIGQLQKLRVLRAHSNKLCKPPKELSKLNNLRVLDLSHNQLERVNLGDLVPQRLSFLDLSGNPRLHVDPSQFNSYRSQRRMSLVDVSGNNRTSLPSAPYHEAGESYQTVDESIEGTDQHIGPPWKIGFSETPGNHNRLYTTQIRLPAFCNTEGLFGLFDGGSVRQVNEAAAETASLLASVVPRILLEERTVKETAADYMKYTLLSAHRELKEKGQRFGACAILCHITAEGNSCKTGLNNIIANEEDGHPQYVLRIASVGRVGAVLCRKDGTLFPLTAPIKSIEENGLNSETEEEENKSQSKIDPQDQHALGLSASFPQVVPDPYVTEVALSPKKDHCIIIANKIFWASVQQDEASHEAGMMLRNSAEACGTEEMLTAKRLQDLAQGYGNTGNLSIIVVHLFGCNEKQNDIRRDGMRKSLSLIQRNGTTDMLMKELKEELRSHHPCHRHCCCHCSWTTEEDKEECHLCLPHVCHRRWCAGMPEERGGCSVENGSKPVAVTNGITHYKTQTLSKSKLSDSKIVQKDEVCTRNKSTVSECHTKTINVAREVCMDEHEVHSKNLPERSSPSGQSDDTPTGSTKDKNDLEDKTSQGNSDSGLSQCTIKENYWDENGKNGEVSKLRRIPGAWDVCVGSESVLMREKGLHKVSAMPALVMTDDYNILGNREKGHSEEESSQVGGVDERFKCWEYMLEQNTQLLFDKELDTISRGIVRGRTRAPWTDGHTANSSGPVHANNSGPPQYRPPPSPAPFLSRRFSSARGVGKGGRGKCSHNGIKWGGSGRGHPQVEIHSPPIQGGPNAAYFGSLQRLLPGHVGFDFEAVQERHRSHNGSRHDDISEGERSWEKDNESSTGETESRMQSYWGVATTEL